MPPRSAMTSAISTCGARWARRRWWGSALLARRPGGRRWGAMGAGAMVGLGLAVAQPGRRVLVVTGDGEILMGLGALATIGVQRPPNLAIAVFDNGHYAETGMQRSHTDHGVSLGGVARSCGIESVYNIPDPGALADLTGG